MTFHTLLAIPLVLCSEPLVGPEEKPVPSLEVHSGADDGPPVRAKLKPIAEFPAPGFHGAELRPAAGGRAILLIPPFGREALAVRIDQPRILGRLPLRKPEGTITANLDGIFTYDPATGTISRHSLRTLQADAHHRLESRQPGSVRLLAGSADRDHPLLVLTGDDVLFLDPDRLVPLHTPVRDHRDPNRQPPFRPSEGAVSSDGRVLVTARTLGVFNGARLDLYSMEDSVWRPGGGLSSHGTHMAHNGRMMPITTREPKSHEPGIGKVIPGIDSPLFLVIDGPLASVWSPCGKKPILRIPFPPGTHPFISFRHQRLALFDGPNERLLIYGFPVESLARDLGAAPWLKPVASRFFGSGETIRASLELVWGTLESIDPSGNMPDLEILDRTLSWKTPIVGHPADFRIGFVARSSQGGPIHDCLDFLVLPPNRR